MFFYPGLSKFALRRKTAPEVSSLIAAFDSHLEAVNTNEGNSPRNL